MSLLLVLLAACGVAEPTPSVPSPVIQSAQTNAYPSPIEATAVPTNAPPTSTVAPTAVASVTATPEPQMIKGVADPAWARFRLVTTFTHSTTGILQLVGWSPDSQRLLYLDTRKPFMVDIATNTTQAFAIETLLVTWSPDGTSIIYIPFDAKKPVVRRYTLATKAIDEYKLPTSSEIIGLKTYQNSVVLVTRDTAFVIDDTKTMVIKQKKSYTLDNADAFVTWSPSGSKGMIVDTKNRQILIPSSRGNLKKYSRSDMSIVWSPSETRIAVADMARDIQIIDSNGAVLTTMRIPLHARVLSWVSGTEDFIYNNNYGGQSPYNAYLLRIGEYESMQINEPFSDTSGVTEALVAPNSHVLAYTASIYDPQTKYADYLVIRVMEDK